MSGGSSPSGFDCSGFTSYLYRQYGVSLSRSSSAQAYGGESVPLASAQPGELYVIQDMLHYILVVDRLFMLLIRVKL